MSLVVEAASSAPPGWDAWLETVPGAEHAASAWWTDAAARHFPAASAVWLLARRDGRLAGGLAAVGRRRVLLRRLESSVEGSPAGPVLDPALDEAARDAAFDALTTAYAARVGGRTVAAVFTLGRASEAAYGARLVAEPSWRREDVPTSLVDLSAGLAHVEARRAFQQPAQ